MVTICVIVPFATFPGNGVFCDVPMTNIRREPSGGWMIFLFIVVSFVIGCVDWMCRLDVPVIPFRMCLFFHHGFWPCRYELLTFPCLGEICFPSQIISGTVIWSLGLDRIIK